MELIIKIDDEVYKTVQDGSYCGSLYKELRAAIPYDKVIDEVTELLENEWGYEGMRDDVARIMKGGTE